MTQFSRLVVLLILGFGVGFVFTSEKVEAQPSSCPAVVEMALSELADNCGSLGRNTACYGNVQVDSTFYNVVEEGYFSHPSDTASLVDLQSIATAPLDLETRNWGMAVLNAQADVPGTLPGQGVTILLMGDASIENRVLPDEAMLAVDPVEIIAKAEAVIRGEPGRDGSVLNIVMNDTNVTADAVNPGREWVRILYDGVVAWVARGEILASAAVIDRLPVVTPESKGPMQAFYFSTGIGPVQCQDAPDVVTIKGKEDLVVNLNVNGADIRIGSTIIFKTLPNNLVAITVIDGHMEIVATGAVVNEGQTAIGILNNQGTIIAWQGITAATPAQLQLGQIAGCVMDTALTGQIPANCLSPLVHTVTAGQTLFSIGMQYQASLPAIVSLNNLNQCGTIYAGQQLVIPDPGSGFIGLAPCGTQPVITTANSGLLNCTGLTPTSPTGGLAFGANTFYWNGIAGATSYQVIVTNLETGQITAFPTSGQQTSLTASLDNTTVGPGFNFSWNVQALVNGQLACTSNQIVTQRGANPPPPPPPFTASWSCNGSDLVISFANGQPGEAILIEFTWIGSPVVLNAVGASGSVAYTIGPVAASNGKVTAALSGQVTLTPSPISC
jgi:LysM repeat protein